MKAKLNQYSTARRRPIDYAQYCTDVKARLDSATPPLVAATDVEGGP